MYNANRRLTAADIKVSWHRGQSLCVFCAAHDVTKSWTALNTHKERTIGHKQTTLTVNQVGVL